MIPSMNPRQMQKMMSSLGIKQKEIPASEVIIRSPGKEIVIKNPHVVKVEMNGQESYQITGESVEKGFSRDDLLTVMDQTGSSEKDAEKALEKYQGDLAEAIMHLKK